jgi:hypothetical protein
MKRKYLDSSRHLRTNDELDLDDWIIFRFIVLRNLSLSDQPCDKLEYLVSTPPEKRRKEQPCRCCTEMSVSKPLYLLRI